MRHPIIADNPLQPVFDHILGKAHPFKIIRSRTDRTILRIPPVTAETGELFVKVYLHHGAAARLKAQLAKTGGFRDFRICKRLARAGLSVPRPVGCAGWPRRRLMPQQTLFAQEWVPNACPLSQLIRHKQESGQLSDQWLTRLYHSIGGFVAAIHQLGFFPRDLHPGNLLFQDGSQNAFDLLLIDYESVRLRRLRRNTIAHLSLGHICSYLNAFSPDAHEQLSLAYLNKWPIDDPRNLVAKVRRVADEHFTARQKRMDRAFDQIALTRKKTRHAP